jgi:low temperature requirement protein LtrA
MVSQWVRAALNDLPRRTCALRYAVGIAAVQVGWVARLALDGAAGWIAFGVLGLVELSIPVWAEAAGRTTWHPHHVAERYGLFTIIVLGESVLAATIGVQRAIDNDVHIGDVVTVVIGGLLIVFAMWWIYFAMPRERATEALRAVFSTRLSGAFAWGYGHYFVFASIAATGAGLALAVDQATGSTPLSDRRAAAAITIPVAVYLVTVWLIHRRHKSTHLHPSATPIAAALIVAASWAPEPVLVTGVILAVLLSVALVIEGRSPISTTS